MHINGGDIFWYLRLLANEALRKKWLDIIGTENVNKKKVLLFCSLRFSDDAYIRNTSLNKHDAVPTTNVEKSAGSDGSQVYK